MRGTHAWLGPRPGRGPGLRSGSLGRSPVRAVPCSPAGLGAECRPLLLSPRFVGVASIALFHVTRRLGRPCALVTGWTIRSCGAHGSTVQSGWFARKSTCVRRSVCPKSLPRRPGHMFALIQKRETSRYQISASAAVDLCKLAESIKHSLEVGAVNLCEQHLLPRGKSQTSPFYSPHVRSSRPYYSTAVLQL